jgi:diguanylate cyclase (GGDEF)-like protein
MELKNSSGSADTPLVSGTSATSSEPRRAAPLAPHVLLDSVEDAIVVIGADFAMRYMNAAARRSFKLEQLPGSDGTALDVIYPDDQPRVAQEVLSLMGRPGAQIVSRFRIVAIDGVRSLEAVITNHLETPGVEGIVGCFRDRSGEVVQQEQNEELKQALDLSADAVMLHDEDGSLIYANPLARSLIKLDERKRGWPFRQQISEALKTFVLPEARRVGAWRGDVDLRDAFDSLRTLSLVVTVIDRPGGSEHVLITGRDETERRDIERQTALRADTDPLTRLPNRATFTRELQRALDEGMSTAMLFVDLDRFKAINDTLGHHHGDELLLIASTRMKAVMRVDEVLGRLGGDEFVVLLADTDDETVRERAAHLSQACLRILSQPVALGDEVIYMTASVGVAFNRDANRDPGQLIRQADLAMFSAKSTGRNRSVEFTPALAETAAKRLRVQAALHEALKNDQFEVVYQPIVAGEGQLSGFEALVRWRHDDGSLRAPAEFLEVAEQSDLITHIDTLVLHQACTQLAEWTEGRPDLHHITMSVNISTRQLRRPDLADVVNEALTISGLAPNRLMLEVTEGSLMEDLDSAIGALRSLQALGVVIAFDDFGTGNCSMAYLRLFNAQVIKIDGRFISNASENSDDVQIIKAISQLASTFAMTTIAEGVETEEQRQLVVDAGCEMMQGYLFDKPLTAADAAERLFGAGSTR